MPAPLRKYQTNYQNCKNVQSNVWYHPSTLPPHPNLREQKKRAKSKKKNLLKALIRFIFITLFLSLFCYCAVPTLYTDYFEPLVLNRILNRSINSNMSHYVGTHLNYLSNAQLMGQNLIVPAQKHSKSMIPIVKAGELTKTKSQLLELFKKYPKMHPAVYVWEYSNAKEIDINASESFPSASIIKLPILFELFRKIDRSEADATFATTLSKKLLYDSKNLTSGSGQLQYTPLNRYHSVDYLAKIMITHSDNSATNMLIEEVGGKSAVNSAMRSLGLNDIRLENRLPDLEGTNKISAKQLGTLLYNLDNQKYLSQKSKIMIKEYMANVENRSLLQAGLPPEAILIHKTGDIGKMLGDAGIVYAQNGRKYIVVILVKRPHNDYGARDLIREASRIIYNNINSCVDFDN